MSVLDFIPSGAANAVTAERIAEQMGIEVRAVRRLVQVERLKGWPICASCEEPLGYFMATESAEVEKYVKSLKRRLRNIIATYTAMQGMLDGMTGQGRIDDFFCADEAFY